jgi:hypothetical protein
MIRNTDAVAIIILSFFLNFYTLWICYCILLIILYEQLCNVNCFLQHKKSSHNYGGGGGGGGGGDDDDNSSYCTADYFLYSFGFVDVGRPL